MHRTHGTRGAWRLMLFAMAVALFSFGESTGGLTQGLEEDSHGESFCKIKSVTITTDVIVADHLTSDNPPYPPVVPTEPNGFVLSKKCKGPVVGTLTVEITGRLHIHEVWARCLSSLGLPGGCTPGVDDENIGYDQSTGNGIHRLFDSNGTRAEVSYPVVTARFTWRKLPPGQWRFFVLPGCIGDCPVTIKSGTFTIEAYSSK
jgi:hypothetical protein